MPLKTLSVFYFVSQKEAQLLRLPQRF